LFDFFSGGETFLRQRGTGVGDSAPSQKRYILEKILKKIKKIFVSNPNGPISTQPIIVNY